MYHVNCLLADDSYETSSLIWIGKAVAKLFNVVCCKSLVEQVGLYLVEMKSGT